MTSSGSKIERLLQKLQKSGDLCTSECVAILGACENCDYSTGSKFITEYGTWAAEALHHLLDENPNNEDQF